MKYHVVLSFVTHGSFYVSAQAMKLDNCCTINRLRFSSRCFYMKEQLLLNLWISDYKFCILYAVLSLYPFLPRTAFRTLSRPLQSQTAGLLLHTMFRLQERKV